MSAARTWAPNEVPSIAVPRDGRQGFQGLVQRGLVGGEARGHPSRLQRRRGPRCCV